MTSGDAPAPVSPPPLSPRQNALVRRALLLGAGILISGLIVRGSFVSSFLLSLILLVIIALLLVPVAVVGVIAYSRFRRRSPRLRLVIIAWLLASIVLLTPFSLSMVRHDFRLARLREAVCAVPAPPGAQVVACAGEVGLMSNGNHCDYAVRLVLRTQLSKTRLANHYRYLAGEQLPLPDGYLYQAPPLVWAGTAEEGERLALVNLEWPGGPGSQGYDFRCT